MRWKGREGRKEREKEGKHYSSVPSKHEMLGYFNKKKKKGAGVHVGEKETLRNRERDRQKETDRERERQSDKQRGGKSGK